MPSIQPADHLVMDRSLNLGVLRQQIPSPGQRSTDGLMPCRQQREYLVPDLLVGHSAMRLFVLGSHEHRHQVIMDLAISSSPSDQVKDHPIYHLLSLS